MKKIKVVIVLVALLSLLLLIVINALAEEGTGFPGPAYEETREAEKTLSDFKYEIISSVGGQTNAVTVFDQTVYVGKGTSIIVLDSTGGALAQTDNSLMLDSIVTNLVVENGILYATAGTAGVYLIDVTDPRTPFVIGQYASDGYAEAVAVRDHFLYIANGEMGLEIVDVSKPETPTFVSRVYKGNYAFGIALIGGYACIAAADDGLLIADITTLDEPAVLSSYDTAGVARCVILRDSLALVADDWQGVCIIDLQDPQNPTFIAQIDTAGRAYDLALSGDMLYIADAYMGLRVLNIHELSSPRDITSYIPIDSQTIDVFIEGDTLYCADQTNGLTCFNVEDTNRISLINIYAHAIPLPLTLPSEAEYQTNSKRIARLGILGLFESDEIQAYKQITRADFAAMLCWAAGLNDTPVEADPVFDDVPTSHAHFADIMHVTEYGAMETVHDNSFEPDGYMNYIDVATCLLRLVHRFSDDGTQPPSILLAAEALGLNEAFSGENMQDNILRGDAMAMLEKIISEITDTKTSRTLLQEMGINLEAAQSVADVCEIWSNYMALPAGYSGVCIFDIHNPNNIRQIAQLNESAFIKLIKVYGNYAYAFSEGGFFTINITNPSSPYTVCSTWFTSGEGGPPRNVVIEDDRMYIADEWGIKVYSIEEPSKPELINQTTLVSDTLAISSCTSDIAVRDGIAYIAFENRGIEIYNVRDVDNIKLIGSYTGNNLWIPNVQFIGEYAIIKTPNGSEILDIQDIDSPVKVGTLEDLTSTQYNYCVGVYEYYLLLPDDTNGVMVVDLSDPANPVSLGWIDTPGIPISVKVDHDIAYIMDGIGGVMIVDLAAGIESVEEPEPHGLDTQKSVSPDSEYMSSWFQGPLIEKSKLSGEEALAVVQDERERTDYTETLIVSSTASNGEGSLIWCVENVLEDGRILFDPNVFPPSHPAVIYLTQEIPLDRVNHVTIDASDAGVILDGGDTLSNCISIYTSGNVIRGLQIQNFISSSINVSNAANIIGGSRSIGDGPNGEGNVLIQCGLMNMNGSFVTDNIIVGNNIGVKADGVTPAGNDDGIQIRQHASRNVIGIEQEGYGNIISNNASNGISSMESPYNNLIEGNYVGTDITGTLAQGNSRNGICFELCGFGTIVRNNITVDNGRYGVLIGDTMSNYNVIIGNKIGVAADDETKMANYEWDVFILGGYGAAITGNVLGGNSSELQNTINTLSIGQMVYNTIIDGQVYHYMSEK